MTTHDIAIHRWYDDDELSEEQIEALQRAEEDHADMVMEASFDY